MSRSADDKPTFGTLEIDGVQLGRWISDYLAHAAIRPATGSTGFDPRMTPTWPGAPTAG